MTQRQSILIIVLALVAGTFKTLYLDAADPPVRAIAPPPSSPIEETEVMMRAKLASSQRVLEGILAEDFTLIARGAKEMKKISEAAEWPRSRDKVYEHFAAEFRRQCNKLERLAQDTNREGVAFTYLQMTTTCIDCHNHVRDTLRIAEQPNSGVRLIPAQLPD
ncbi:MAG: hypothetical protein ACR2NZ_00960 [Rubripirellula sp.]